MKNRLKTFLVCLSIPFFLVHAVECDFDSWQNYQQERLLLNSSKSAFIFQTEHKAIDADGAPNAYHPDNTGLDNYLNAGYPNHSWWNSVLVQDPNDPTKPYIQEDGEFAGYFISKTSLFDKNKDMLDVSRYVDATKIPYLVFPGKFYSKKGTGRLGDIGMAFNLKSGESSAFVVADVGPSNASLGEISMALAENLGGTNVNPRNGAGKPKGNILYVLFPYSSKKYPWPLDIEEIHSVGKELVESVGGAESLLACSASM
ncbi:glycoside hydrolase family 75 protein [Aliiglaciecola sp. 2_MG-2023]|uniref:glycoside hydrolase family 75 protein n=1 Tax=Alteromonadaceae TaxID=72275 RepID=UPI0026E3C2EA|nr:MULTISPECIES: glycoside hydrolase family 75 protein [unclassified Aliiglaciecola]MDO6710480.1 glycoside hydrolase family 75 protein [Aliiglaciecola sp. 2_MG-2023]MDO6751655.1 glycoside hydrolase family 75 protein [Aliiglaciecola sp. 1_MG-2023]